MKAETWSTGGFTFSIPASHYVEFCTIEWSTLYVYQERKTASEMYDILHVHNGATPMVSMLMRK